MNRTTYIRRSVTGLGLGAIVLTSFGCAHVNREELGTELAQIRQEMAEGDAQVAQRLDTRIDGVEARVDGLEGRMDLVEQDLSALEDRFNVTVDRLEVATRVNTPIYFAFNEDGLKDEDKPLLEDFGAIVLTYFPDALVTVEGFADPAGSASYNLKLGQRRAQSVRDYLINNTGLPGDKVRAVSYGEDVSRQVVRGEIRDEGWQNRRVVLVIDHGSNMAQQGVVATSNEGR